MVFVITSFVAPWIVKVWKSEEEAAPSTESKDLRIKNVPTTQSNQTPCDTGPSSRSPLISTLVNSVMKSGKKSIAQRIVYGAIEKMARKA